VSRSHRLLVCTARSVSPGFANVVIAAGLHMRPRAGGSSQE
jgi:hypothetical protein